MILGDSRNYMPPILAPSSAKRIATQVLVTAKINGRKYFILRVFVCDWWCHSSQQGITYSKLATRIRYESCSILRMSMLTIFLPLRRRSSVVIVNCKHISNFVLIRAVSRANFIPVDRYGRPKNCQQNVKLLGLTCVFVKRNLNGTHKHFSINYPYNSKCGKTIFSFNFSFG